MKRLVPYLVAALIAAGIVWSFLAPAHRPPSIVPSTQASASPTASPAGQTVTLSGTSLASREADRVFWELTARTITAREADHAAVAEDIQCNFFDAAHHPIIRMTAKAARVNLKTNSVDFEGAVRAVGVTGEVITVDHLRWDGPTKRLLGSGRVLVTRQSSMLVADALVADPQKRTVEVKGRVRIIWRGTVAGLSPDTFGQMLPGSAGAP